MHYSWRLVHCREWLDGVSIILGVTAVGGSLLVVGGHGRSSVPVKAGHGRGSVEAGKGSE